MECGGMGCGMGGGKRAAMMAVMDRLLYHSRFLFAESQFLFSGLDSNTIQRSRQHSSTSARRLWQNPSDPVFALTCAIRAL